MWKVALKTGAGIMPVQVENFLRRVANFGFQKFWFMDGAKEQGNTEMLWILQSTMTLEFEPAL